MILARKLLDVSIDLWPPARTQGLNATVSDGIDSGSGFLRHFRLVGRPPGEGLDSTHSRYAVMT